MDDPDTTQQNGGFGLEGRDSGSEKRSVRGGIAGRKDYARDKLTNGSKTLPDTDGRPESLDVFAISLPQSWSTRAAWNCVRNRAGN